MFPISPVIVISDCQDANARARVCLRLAAIFGVTPIFIAVTGEIEAAGNLVDMVDALAGKSGLILMNPAPRGKYTSRWPDGAPFGHVRVAGCDIITTVNGYALSLLQKVVKGPIQVNVFDTRLALERLATTRPIEAVVNSQFRSFEFLPWLAQAVISGNQQLSSEPLGEIPTIANCIWWIDHFGTSAFGNLKTTLLPQEIDFTPEENIVALRIGDDTRTYQCYKYFKAIPDGQWGLVIGSSGLDEQRFIEVILKGGNAAKELGCTTGTPITAVAC